MINKKKKYLFFGDGHSVHLLKWIKEVQAYFQVYAISSQGFSKEIEELLPVDNRFSLQANIQKEKASIGILNKFYSLKKIIKELKPDYVNAHYISSHGFLIALLSLYSKPSYKFIASAWGTDVLVFPWKNKAQFYAMKFILSKADFITSDSNYMSSVIKKIKHKQVLTFTFGLDRLPEYKENRKDENLYFSNRMLSENYNIDQVLENFALIYQENPNAQLLISHKGEEEANLKALCGKLEIHKAVKFLGFLKEQEQIDLYQKAACYFSLPTSDSTSVSLLEAMAYGCIPLLSDIPANREWVIDGENGLLIKEQISLSKLARLMENRAEVIKQNRGIISNRALFPDLIKTFVNEITK